MTTKNTAAAAVTYATIGMTEFKFPEGENWTRISDHTVWSFEGRDVVVSFDGRGTTERSSERRRSSTPADGWEALMYGEGPATDRLRDLVRNM